MKNLSVRKAVLEYLKLNPGSKAGKIAAGTYKPIAQVYTSLGMLTKKGILRRRNHAYWLVDSVPMTALNPEQPNVQVQMPNTSKPVETPITYVMRKAEAENKRLHEEVETLKDQLQDMSVKYYDAVAVINYLEKFFSTKK